jgi:hypothetical protein
MRIQDVNEIFDDFARHHFRTSGGWIENTILIAI